MIQPPELIAIHPDTGQAFSLTDEAFSRWWAATVMPEDAMEYVHLHHGTIEEARYVCAIDYLTNVLGEVSSADTVLRAYSMAKNQPLDMHDSQARTNAHYLSQSDGVSYLLDRVRHRSRRIAEERIANLATTKIEEMFQRTHALDGKERLDTERAALETSVKFLANQARERGQEAERRQKRSMQAAIERGRGAEYDTTRLPSLAEAKLHLAMLVDGYGAEALTEILKTLTPLELPSADKSSH